MTLNLKGVPEVSSVPVISIMDSCKRIAKLHIPRQQAIDIAGFTSIGSRDSLTDVDIAGCSKVGPTLDVKSLECSSMIGL